MGIRIEPTANNLQYLTDHPLQSSWPEVNQIVDEDIEKEAKRHERDSWKMGLLLYIRHNPVRFQIDETKKSRGRFLTIICRNVLT